MSFAAKRGLNTIFIMWQQYLTFLTGLLLSLTVSGLFAVSYYQYETESGLDQQTILKEGSVYFVTSMLSFFILLRNNKAFQSFYQSIYSSPPLEDFFDF